MANQKAPNTKKETLERYMQTNSFERANSYVSNSLT